MIHALLGTKGKQTQVFDERGLRLPATVLRVGPCPITHIKRVDSDGYWSVQLGFGNRKEKNVTKPQQGHIKKTGLTKMPRFLREIRISEEEIQKLPKLGDAVTVNQVFAAGDIISVTGTSKGKGFAGGVKRHHFAGGPATHGQSDRERAPGSIGGTTTPGRVYKGKRMAGRMGGDTVTIKGLHVVGVVPDKDELIVSGLIPGAPGGLVIVRRLSALQVSQPAEEK